jgi:hypothetical protein
MFIAVGHDGVRLSSREGENWTETKLGREGEIYRAACFADRRFVAIGSYGGGNILACSSDGIDWRTKEIDAKYSRYLRGIAHGQGEFLAFGGDAGNGADASPVLLRSKDGIDWSDYLPINGKNILRRVAFGANMFVGVGDRGRRAVSADGVKWTDAPDVKAIDTLIDVACGQGVFVGVGLHGLRMSTRDGLAWSNRQVGEEGEHLNSIVWTGERFIAVGAGATYTSADGAAWKREPNRDAPLTVAFGSGVFLGASWRGRISISTDAVHWKQVYKSDHNIEALSYGLI